MEISKDMIHSLVNRLKIGNRRGVHLNILPGGSRYKFDLDKLRDFNETSPIEFINILFNNSNFNFIVTPTSNSQNGELIKTCKSLQNLINHSDSIESEKGINSFGFGFPTLIYKSKIDNKLIFSPILIWSLKIKPFNQNNSFQIIKGEDDPIYVNEVLINYLESDNGIKLGNLSTEMIEDGLIDLEELSVLCNDIYKKFNSTKTVNKIEQFIDIEKLRERKYYEEKHLDDTPHIINSGLFSIYEVQKQNLINDYKFISDKIENIDIESFTGNKFQSISSIKTDPSQQYILNSLSNKRNIIIQGPPGTGKSQSLTGVLVNSLENNKKTLVVCEKRTALEVLESNLNELGLSRNCILIRDTTKDRKLVVDNVRSRIDNVKYKNHYYPYSKSTYEMKLQNINELVKIINESHKKLKDEIYEGNNWSDIVGLYLDIKKEKPIDEIKLKNIFNNLNELNRSYYSNILPSLESKYGKCKKDKDTPSINFKKLVTENEYLTEKELKIDIENSLNYFFSEKKWFDETEDFYKNEVDFFNCSITKDLKYRFLSVFSKKKKKIIQDQVNYTYKLNQLINRLKSEELYDFEQVSQILVDTNPFESIKNLNRYFKDFRDYYSTNDRIYNEIQWYSSLENLSENDKSLVKELTKYSNWDLVFQTNLFDKLLDQYASKQLPIDFESHSKLSELLEDIKQLQLKYINDLWYYNLIESSRKFYQEKGILVENLYNKRSSSKFKRNSLRQIVKSSIDLFTDFFPIVLTTPDVASNLFGMMEKSYFDFVLFDEASQLRIEDTLPSLLKGKQIIVAGDEHQMPPSNYFSKVYEGQEENEIEDEIDTFNPEEYLLGSESLLEFSSEFGFEKCHLDFHYRSRHPDLIQFSNYAFYQGRLKPMLNVEDYNPISFYQVSGMYSDNTNQKEADFVIEIIDKKINILPNGKYPSLGIATFNISQRDLILEKILDKRRLDQNNEFNQKMNELEKEGFFVKNLENIQGDERDVIIVSTTYGVNNEGKFFRRFGQINQQKGYKLLNVIITRAKHKLYICTSIPENEYLSYSELIDKEGSNNRFSIFYSYLSYCKSISENNLELKSSILKKLSDNIQKNNSKIIGHQNLPLVEYISDKLKVTLPTFYIKTNQRISEFEVDIVLVMKDDQKKIIIIEIDGNKEQTSDETYLIDLYREEVLKKFGFIVIRTWSVNWWRNSERELENLLFKINSTDFKNINPKKTQFSDSFIN